MLSTIYPQIFRPMVREMREELKRVQYYMRMTASMELDDLRGTLEPKFIIISWKGVMKYYHMLNEGDAYLYLSLIQAIEMFGKSITGSKSSMKHFKLDKMSLLGINLPENFCIHYGFNGDEDIARKQLQK